MKKNIDNSGNTGGLFSPDSIPMVKNTGMVCVLGWCDGKKVNIPSLVRIKVGKRMIDTPFGDCLIEKEKNENQTDFHLFQMEIKVGPGIKRIHVFVVGEDGSEHPVGNRLIRQIDRVQSLPGDEELPPAKSDYEQWLQNDEPLLRFVEGDPEIVFPVTLTWIVELKEGNKNALHRTLINLLSHHHAGIRIHLIDNGQYFSGWSGNRRKIGYESHPAIRVFGRGAINLAVEESGSEWLGFLEEGDEVDGNLYPDFLKFLSRNPDTRLFYTDYDHRAEDGSLNDPMILPGWNRDLLTSFPYFGDVFMVKREAFVSAGGFGDEKYHRNWALMLKLSRACKRSEIGRLCGIYFHLARKRKLLPSEEADCEAEALLKKHLDETGENATVSRAPGMKGWRLQYDIPSENGVYPKVSLLIPTRDGVEVLSTCIDSILEKTEYPNFEIIILDNHSEEPETLEYFKDIREKGCRVVSCPGEFNYSQINNRGSMEADGTLLGFLNNDLEVIDGSWLSEMVAQAMREKIGAVGAKLLYPDGTLQHAGVLIGVGHVAAHAFRLFDNDPENGPLRAHVIQNYSAVTAACLLVRREIFKQVGGFDDVDLSITNNDVDLCIKIREAGYRNIYTPFATLMHHESATRGPEDTPEKWERYTSEVEYMWKKWPAILIDDPAYNRLLTRFKEDFSLASKEELTRYVPGKTF